MFFDLYNYLMNMPRYQVFVIVSVGYLIYYLIEVVKVSRSAKKYVYRFFLTLAKNWVMGMPTFFYKKSLKFLIFSRGGILVDEMCSILL